MKTMELLAIMAKALGKAVKLIATSVVEAETGERYLVKSAKFTNADKSTFQLVYKAI